MPPAFRVVAILATYNEADIIEHVVRDLIEQGVDVHVLDDGSTDDTVAIVEAFLGRGVVGIEPLAPPRDSEGFAWERILRRKEEIARTIDADWCIHHDADEFRESPWVNISLRDAIERVDELGFNAIDFASLDFWPADDRFRPGEDVRDALPLYADAADYDRVQIRAWKKTRELDLASSAGHEARFPGRSVFPIRFVLRHYPIRGQAHGERKVFRERRGRFPQAERERGWHVQYDALSPGDSFVRGESSLKRYDALGTRIGLALRHRGVEALESTVETSERALTATQSALEEARVQVAEAQARLVAARTEVETTSAAAERLRHALATLSESLAATRQALAERTDALATSAREVEARGEALEERAATIARLQQSIDGLTRRIEDLHGSRSWRWMAPARAVFRLLGGR
jgi:glycosyltransferase involved in cell wall biosynthesis